MILTYVLPQQIYWRTWCWEIYSELFDVTLGQPWNNVSIYCLARSSTSSLANLSLTQSPRQPTSRNTYVPIETRIPTTHGGFTCSTRLDLLTTAVTEKTSILFGNASSIPTCNHITTYNATVAVAPISVALYTVTISTKVDLDALHPIQCVSFRN